MGLADALDRVLRAAPELKSSPDLAIAAAGHPDPEMAAQALAHTARTFAYHKAVVHASATLGSEDALHQTLSWFGDAAGAVGDAASTAGDAIGAGLGRVIGAQTGNADYSGVGGGQANLSPAVGIATQASHIANMGLSEVQHQYRTVHDIEARHGPAAGLLAGLGIVTAGVAAATAAVVLAPEVLAGAGLTALGAAILGSEATSAVVGRTAFQDSWARTNNGEQYQGNYNRQTGQYFGQHGGVSPGQDFAEHLPHSLRFTSGVVDGLFDLTFDPTVIGGKAFAAAREARLTVNTVEGFDRAMSSPLTRNGIRTAFNNIAKITSPAEIVTRWPKFEAVATDLAKLNTADDVATYFRNHVGIKEFEQATDGVLPNLPITRLPLKAVQTALRESNVPLLRTTNLLPVWLDKETLRLSNKVFDPSSDNWAKGVYRALRFGQNHEVASGVVDEMLAADIGARRVLYKNAIYDMLHGESGLNLSTDNRWAKTIMERIDSSVADVGGREQVYSTNALGRNLSTLPAVGDQAEHAAAVFENQTGNWAFPDINEVLRARRAENSLRNLMGAVDDGFYHHFTEAIFKRGALLTGGFAFRIAAAEAIPAAFREGALNLVRSSFQLHAGKALYDEEEVGHIAAAMYRLMGGFEKGGLRSGADSALAARVVEMNGGHLVSPALSTGAGAANFLDGEVDKTVGLLGRLLHDVPPSKRMGDEFGIFAGGVDPERWQAALREVSKSEMGQEAAAKLHSALTRGVEVSVPFDVATVPSSDLYHGASTSIDTLTSRYEQASSDNLFGPGFYATDNPEVALSYTRKGAIDVNDPVAQDILRRWEGQTVVPEQVTRLRRAAASSPTVHGVRWTGDSAPRLLDLESTLPEDARQAFADHVNQGMTGLDYEQATEDRLQALLADPSSSGADIYSEIRKAYSEAHLPRFEVDEALHDLADSLDAKGYDGVRYQGGVRTGSSIQHEATMFFDPSKLEVTSRTSVAATVSTRPATMRQATARATKAVQDILDAKPEEWLAKFERHTVSSTANLTPHEDWAKVIVESVKGVTGSPLDDEVHHLNLLESLANGETPAIEDLHAISPAERPWIKGRKDVLPLHESVTARIANVGYAKVLDPIINGLSREPMYFNEIKTQYKPLQALVDAGVLSEDEALRIAQVRSVNAMLPFIHNPMERSQFAQAARNFMPFYFAQTQAYRRVGRLLADNPGAFRQYMLATTALMNVGHIVTDEDGNQSTLIPGAGFLAGGAAQLLGQLGIGIKTPVPVGFTGNVSSLNTVFPLAEEGAGLSVGPVKVNFGPIVSLPTHVITHFFPEFSPVEDTLLGTVGAQGDLWEQFVPNTPLRNLIKGTGAVNSRALNNAMIQTIQALDFRQQKAMKKWDEGGRKGPQPDIAPNPDQWLDPRVAQRFIDRVRNQSRVLLTTKALLSLVSPVSMNVEVGDWGLRQEVRDLIASNGPDGKPLGLGGAISAFLAKHPDATVYTVFSSKNDVAGDLPATHPAQDWLTHHSDLLSKYPQAAAWLIPQSSDPYSQAVYNEQLATHLRHKKAPDEVQRDIYIALGNHQFYDIDLPIHQKALLAAGDDPDAVKAENASWSAYVQNTIGAQNPIWFDDLGSQERKHRRDAAIAGLTTMFANGDAPAGPQTDAVKGLLADYRTHLDAVTVGRQDGWAADERQAEDASWQAYLVSVAKDQPILAPIINRVFRSA